MSAYLSCIGKLFWRANSFKFAITLVCISAASALLLIAAALVDDVIYIPGGVGLVQNYGLIFSHFAIPAVLMLVRCYCKFIASCLMGAMRRSIEVRNLIKELKEDVQLSKRSRRKRILIIFSYIGLCFWIRNVTLHAIGQSAKYWHSPVFDSTDHFCSFIANRLVSVLAWIFVVPFCIYVGIISTVTLLSIAKAIKSDPLITYDPLHPDHAGGFAFVADASLVFNITISIIYSHITIFVITFSGRNSEHIILYLLATVGLIFGNSLVFGKIGRVLEDKKLRSLNFLRRNNFDGSRLNFEVYRYYVESFSKEKRRGGIQLSVNVIRGILPLVAPGIRIFTS